MPHALKNRQILNMRTKKRQKNDVDIMGEAKSVFSAPPTYCRTMLPARWHHPTRGGQDGKEALGRTSAWASSAGSIFGNRF